MDILIKQFDLEVGVISLVPDLNCADHFDLAQPMGEESRPWRNAS